jgi:hypothetical protein
MLKEDIRYTISARGKKEQMPILEFLQTSFPGIPLEQVDSVFGFTGPSTLYSGRPFMRRQLSEADTRVLSEQGIGLRLPLSNHYISMEEYESQRPFLELYHQTGNSVICTNDMLAKQVRRDFPDYQVEASVLKEIDTREKIDRALDLYDTVILPANLNSKNDFLVSLDQKDRITLFGNAGCALTCPDRICYEHISRINKKLVLQDSLSRYWTFLIRLGLPIDWCSNRLHPRKLKGVVDFDLGHLYSLGFRRFKMLREHKKRQTGH